VVAAVVVMAVATLVELTLGLVAEMAAKAALLAGQFVAVALVVVVLVGILVMAALADLH